MRAFISVVMVPAVAAFVGHHHLGPTRPGSALPSLAGRRCRGVGAAPRMQSESALGDDIEDALLHKWGRDKVGRVIDSFNRTRKGDAFEKDWPGKGLQQAASYMEGLFAEPWHDPYDKTMYPWATALEEKAGVIAEELKAAMAKKDLARKGNNVWVAAARDDALAYGPDWRTLVIQDRDWDPTNMKLFPKTAKIVKECGIPSAEVFFARQAPKTGIKPHTDDTNFILTMHLGLDVPEGECRMTVGGETREWRNGKLLIFDTSFVHSTANDADVPRTVLLIRFFHPEVTKDERDALMFIFDCISDPSILEAEAEAAAALAAGIAVDTSGLTRQERRALEKAAKKKAGKGAKKGRVA